MRAEHAVGVKRVGRFPACYWLCPEGSRLYVRDMTDGLSPRDMANRALSRDMADSLDSRAWPSLDPWPMDNLHDTL